LAKKLSRKDLKEPDEFLSFTVRALKWISDQKVTLLVGALALLVVILGTFAWRWHSQSLEKAASHAFMQAREILDARVIPREDSAGTSSSDGSFFSEDDKFKAAIAEFEQVTKNHSNSATATLATYYVAEYSRRIGDYDKAIESFKNYLRAEGTGGELAAFAVEGIAASLEAQGKNDQATQQYQRLTEHPFDMQPERGRFHVARLEQKAGRTEEAVRLFNEIIEKHPKTTYLRDIEDRLSMLEKPEKEKKPEEETKEETKEEKTKKEKTRATLEQPRKGPQKTQKVPKAGNTKGAASRNLQKQAEKPAEKSPPEGSP
jgi:tetratricopeptide (TPR) repeat protein